MVWRSTHKAVHTQGGAHTRRSVATAGVLSFKGGVQGLAPASSEASGSEDFLLGLGFGLRLGLQLWLGYR